MNRKPDKIDKEGNQYWYDVHLDHHNDNGYPAEIWSNGTKFWYKHGLLHNENGPAIIWASGPKRWYIDGEEYTEQQFKQHKIKQFIYE